VGLKGGGGAVFRGFLAVTESEKVKSWGTRIGGSANFAALSGAQRRKIVDLNC
jgi:hypothetical protein